jgi:hypothetical protein
LFPVEGNHIDALALDEVLDVANEREGASEAYASCQRPAA